jgi:predicted deacylase
VHCGDGNEELTEYVSFFADAPDPAVSSRSRAMALAFGPSVVKLGRDPQRNPAATQYTTNTAVSRGVAAIGIEIGGRSRVESEEVEKVQNGLLNVLRHLGGWPAIRPRSRSRCS